MASGILKFGHEDITLTITIESIRKLKGNTHTEMPSGILKFVHEDIT